MPLDQDPRIGRKLRTLFPAAIWEVNGGSSDIGALLQRVGDGGFQRHRATRLPRGRKRRLAQRRARLLLAALVGIPLARRQRASDRLADALRRSEQPRGAFHLSLGERQISQTFASS